MKSTDVDVTKDVSIGWVDEECAQIKKCVCGNTTITDQALSIYRDMAWTCSKCGRKLIIAQTLRVLEIREEDDGKG